MTMATPGPAATEPHRRGFLALATGIFHAPGEVGVALSGGVPWRPVAAALLVVLLVVVAGAFVTLPYLQKDQIEQMRKNPELRGEQLEFVERFMASPAGKAMTIVSQPAVVAIGIGLVSLLLYLGQLVMAGRATWSASLAVTAFACLISFGVGTVVRALLCVVKGSFFDVSTGLGVLVSDRAPNDPVRALLDVFDVFTLWAAVSAGIALGPPARLKPGMTVAISLVIYFVLMGIGAAARVFFAR
jgi:hypothetical protein